MHFSPPGFFTVIPLKAFGQRLHRRLTYVILPAYHENAFVISQGSQLLLPLISTTLIDYLLCEGRMLMAEY